MRSLKYVLTAAMLFSAMACSSADEAANANNASAANGTAAAPAAAPGGRPFTVSGDPRADIIGASKLFLEQPHFRARMQSSGASELNMDLAYQSPDRYHIVNRIDQGGAPSEFIVIGSDMYMKAGEKWQKMPGAGEGQMPRLRDLFDEESLKMLQDVKYIGEEAIDGRQTHVYSYRNPAGKDDEVLPFTSRIWIGAADGLPHRIVVEYEEGEMDAMNITYDYTSAVSIEPPAAN